jgi:cell division control protein 24
MAPQLPQQPMVPPNRLRSASSPDIHNPSGQPRRGLPNSHPHPPVPPFPPHIAYGASGINRSQNNSPTAPPNVLPIRAATQSPGAQRERLGQQLNYYQNTYAPEQQILPRSVPPPLRTVAPIATQPLVDREISPALGSSSLAGDHSGAAVQLKVKVTFLDNYVTLVVSSNIKYQSLANRIDHKLARSTALSIGSGSLRLRYKDEDGDFVTIHSDDDIQMAIADWREQQNGNMVSPGMAEIQLYCQTIEN